MASPWDFLYIWVEHTTRYPTFTGSMGYDTSSLCPYLTAGEVRKMVQTVSGLDHLEGQIVSVVADGLYAGQFTVSGGAISLNTSAAVIHVGLPYTGKIKLLPLGGDGQSVNEAKERKVYDVVMRVDQSLGGKFGKDEDSLYSLDFPTTDDVLFTGDLHDVPFESSWDTSWQPVFVQDKPLPFMILAFIIRSEIEESK